MTPDELRALADALDRIARTHAMIAPDESEMQHRAADYLRACADNPAPAVPAGWKLVPVEPTPEMLDEGCDVDARAEVIQKYAAMPVIRNPENCCSCGEMLAVQYRAMIAAAPAAPQAEPCIGNDPACPCQDGDACHYKDGADGTKAWPVPQSEPKRKPACLWSRADDDTDTWETACRHAFTIIEGTPTDNSMAFCCYCGRPLEQEIGGSDAE